MSREHLAGLGEPDVAPQAFDEGRAGALLEAPNHLRDRRLGEPEGGRRSGEAALVGDGLHDPKAGGVDHGPIITSGYRTAKDAAHR